MRLTVLPFLLCVLVIDVSSMWVTHRTYDESRHVYFSERILEGRWDADTGQSMAISLVNYLPVRGLVASGIRLSDRMRLFVSRLPSVLAALVMVALVFWWARRLYGPRGALLAATLATVCPTVIAHSRLVTNDIWCACLMFASTVLFVRYLEAPTVARLLVCAAVTGAAQTTKQTALLLFPIFAVVWLFDARRALRAGAPVPGGPAWRLAAHAALGAAVIVVVLNAGYLFHGTLRPLPAYVADYQAQRAEITRVRSLRTLAWLASHAPDVPVPLPHAYVYAFATGMYYNATAGGHGGIYLLGKLSQKGWWYYFLVAFVLKTPLPVIVILAAAAALTPRWFGRKPRDEGALLTGVAVVFAFFSFACTAQLGIRYVLPAFPFLFVAAGKVAAFTPARYAGAYRAGLAALVLWGTVSSFSFHPHYIAYANELISDRKHIYKYLADSNVDWGQSDADVPRYVAAQSPERRVAVNPPSPVAGRVIVNINALVGVTSPPEKYAWLREHFEPVDHVGYAWLVYDVPPR